MLSYPNALFTVDTSLEFTNVAILGHCGKY